MMRKSVVLAAAVGLPLLAGCSTIDSLWEPDEAARQAEATKTRMEQLTRDINGCALRRDSDHPTTRVDYALCINMMFQSAMQDVQYPYPDIVATLSAERLRAAELADKGQISTAEGLARISDKISEVVRIERARSATQTKHAEVAPPQYFLQLMQVGL
jgi:outer membrane murein-binding lipoprotein Lpp